MRVVVNGNEEIMEKMTILQYVLEKGISEAALKGIIIEHNEAIIKQSKWGTTELNENDSLEVIKIMGGG